MDEHEMTKIADWLGNEDVRTRTQAGIDQAYNKMMICRRWIILIKGRNGVK